MAFAEDLRALAEWLDQHPEFEKELSFRIPINITASNLREFQEKARRFGKAEKVVDDGYYILRKSFGGILIDLFISKVATCKRIKVGTRHVAELHIPAHDEDIYEWRCPESVLREGGDLSEKMVEQYS